MSQIWLLLKAINATSSIAKAKSPYISIYVFLEFFRKKTQNFLGFPVSCSYWGRLAKDLSWGLAWLNGESAYKAKAWICVWQSLESIDLVLLQTPDYLILSVKAGRQYWNKNLCKNTFFPPLIAYFLSDKFGVFLHLISGDGLLLAYYRLALTCKFSSAVTRGISWNAVCKWREMAWSLLCVLIFSCFKKCWKATHLRLGSCQQWNCVIH